MLDDTLALPGNKAVFEDLKNLISKNKAVAFVGAGASAGMYPLWGKFIDLLAEHAVAQGKADGKDAARWKADTASTPQQRVNIIVRRLGEPLYRGFLRETFGPRKGSDSKRYTPTHGAVMRLAFRGFVTTNYDPALDFARAEVRPGSLTTGTPTWEDDDEVYRWRTGDVFADECPILWAHGYWQRPGGIVLNSGEYSQAYKPGIYRETFKELWIRDHLVLLGFGFADPQFTFMVGEFLRDIAEANAAPRHIGILSWQLSGDGSAPDAAEITEKRENLEADYHVRPLFYPVRDNDHSALGELLKDLAGSSPGSVSVRAITEPALVIPLTPTVVLPPFHEKWIHETTDDAKFTGRDEEIARLNRWMRDAVVRTLAICAVGGTGKTALAGHWLKRTPGWRSRPFTGLFAWSFYQERDTLKFLERLLAWGHEVFGTPAPSDKTDLVDQALTLLREHPLVVVLDGLEVLQEGPDDARHGSFLDGDLREFLHALCQLEVCDSIALLTSRFVFADLERHLGTAFHQLDLPGLGAREGADLLAELSVRGTVAEREEISERLDGHPLGLRVFAGALPESERDDPRGFLDHAFQSGGITSGSALNDKLLRLLAFYEKQLPPEQSRLLGVVSLFPSPVGEKTILRLFHGLFMSETDSVHDVDLGGALRKLHRDHILTREPIEDGHGYAAHPILKDHFRRILFQGRAETARRAADLLKGQPSNELAKSVRDIEPVLIAIELLLEASDFPAAAMLYRQRFAGGHLFQAIPAVPEGLACSSGFVRDEHRRRQCQEQLSRQNVGFFLNDAGLYASISGHYELALQYYSDASVIARELKDVPNTIIGLQNEVALLVSLGRLAEADQAASEALRLAMEMKDESEIRDSLSDCGWTAALVGHVDRAAEHFALANLIERTNDPDGDELYSSRGIKWAELLLRSGHHLLAARRTLVNLQISERYRRNDTVAECRALLAACDVAADCLDDADAEFRAAEAVLRRGQFLHELARLYLTAGDIAVAREDEVTALYYAAEALALAAVRGMRLVHADALILRGKARLLMAEPDRARDDGEEGLRLARDCGYVWAERDALDLLAKAAVLSARQVEKDSAPAHRWRTEALVFRAEFEVIASRLKLDEANLAAADSKAVASFSTWKNNAENEN